MIKYTINTLKKLEQVYHESDYQVRYGKGNFQSGHCLLEQKRIVVINRLFTIEGKISCLIDLLPSVDINLMKLTQPSIKLYEKLIESQAEIVK